MVDTGALGFRSETRPGMLGELQATDLFHACKDSIETNDSGRAAPRVVLIRVWGRLGEAIVGACKSQARKKRKPADEQVGTSRRRIPTFNLPS